MKIKTNLSAVAGLGTALLLVFGGAGCASSNRPALTNLGPQSQHQGFGFSRGSEVSPLGDAPGERDLESIRTWPAEHRNPGVSGIAGPVQTGPVR